MKIYRLDKTTQRMKISQYLREIQNYSGRSLRNISVMLDGKIVKTTKKLPQSGILKVIEKDKNTNISPIKMDLDIVYEDEDILIINKPYNLVVHPTKKNVDITLANGVVEHIKTVPRFYNRLDMDTTGLIVVAKNSYTQNFLQNNGNVKKKYMAIVYGKLEKDIIIDKPILKVDDELRRIVDDKGKNATTIVKVVEYYEKSNTTVVECELLTGRTHQIRVHLSSIGHPIVGDKLYSDKIEKCRQKLHSYYLEFNHPRTDERKIIEIPLYEDMKED